jgi:RNA polymerase sigma-70 factor (ECF subfamily)
MSFLNEKEFKNFYLKNFKGLKIYIYAKCSDLDMAEDIAQESFVRLWQNIQKISPDKAKSFVYTVGGNLFLDFIRHEKVKNKYNSTFKLIQDNKDPLFYLEMEEFKLKLELTISKMPTTSREVFLMNRIEKMTYQQIADSLGLSVKAIEKRMQKALELMATITQNKI